MEPDITEIEEIIAWKKHPVTILFFANITEGIQDTDEVIHQCIAKNNLEEARVQNAYMEQMKEVLLIPEMIIAEIKEKLGR